MAHTKDKLPQVTIHRLARAARDVAIQVDDSYLLSYPYLVQHFRRMSVVDQEALVVGAHAVYGWMPTVLEFKGKSVSEALTDTASLLNAVKHGTRLDEQQLDLAKSLINNSVGGLSKLLHFINPDLYPMWDSNVYRFIVGERGHPYQINNVGAYLSYVGNCDELIRHQVFGEVHRSVEAAVRYPVSAYRAAELVMFLAGRSAGSAGR